MLPRGSPCGHAVRADVRPLPHAQSEPEGNPMSRHPVIHPPIGACVLALGLAAASLPAFAQSAQCPPDTPLAQYIDNWDGTRLRCTRRQLAPPACPPTHPQKVAMPPATGQDAVPVAPFGGTTDFCRPFNIIITAPSQAAQVICPPGLQLDVRNGPDVCRSSQTTPVPPILVP